MSIWRRGPPHFKARLIGGVLGGVGVILFGLARGPDPTIPVLTAAKAGPATIERLRYIVAAFEHGNPETKRLIVEVSHAFDLRPKVVRRYLTSLASRPYRGIQIAEDLLLMVTMHRELDSNIRRPPADDEEPEEDTDRLRAAWKTADLPTVRGLLIARHGRLKTALEEARRQNIPATTIARHEQAVADAALDLGRLALIDTGHAAAAPLFRAAALALPPGDYARRASLLALAADTFTIAGVRGQDVPALDEAIALASAAAELVANSVRVNAATWTHAHVSLGKAHLHRADALDDPRDLNAAADALRIAVSDLAHYSEPGPRAAVQSLFARTLVAIIERTHEPAPLREAADMLRAGLHDLEREDAPHAWGLLQRTLGSVLSRLATLTGDAAMAGAAVEAHRLGLDGLTPNDGPEEWARSRLDFGLALYTAGALRSDSALAEEGAAVLADVGDFFARNNQAELTKVAANLEAAARDVAARARP